MTVAAPVKSADRTLDVFELLAAEPQGLTVSEISERLGLARSSAHGLVRTLHSRGYLMENGGRRFHLGARLIQLGLNVVDRLELRAAARGPLERLVADTHDTALLVVPDKGDLLYVDKVISDARDVRTDPRVSSRRPLHCSSLGKALLAAVDDESVLEVVAVTGLERATEFSIGDRDGLLADLARTRERGYAARPAGGARRGCGASARRCATTPAGRVGAISLSTIKDFFDPERTGPRVAATAVEISRAMGWTGDAVLALHAGGGLRRLLARGRRAAEMEDPVVSGSVDGATAASGQRSRGVPSSTSRGGRERSSTQS